MAASITPSEAGIKIEPVETVVVWAKFNHQQALLGGSAIAFETFQTLRKSEEQLWQQQR